jgi:hypothetical protein
MRRLERISFARHCAGALLLLAILTIACGEERLIPAVGPYSDIYFFTEAGRFDPPLRAFAAQLSHPVRYTFEEENEFNVFLREGRSLSGNRDRKNILVMVRTDKDGSLRNSVRKMLGKEIFERARAEGHLILYREDLWAYGQDVFFVLINGPEEEDYVLERMAPTLQRRFRDSTLRRYRRYLLNGRENKGGSKYLWRKYNFSLRYPKEYHLLQDRPEIGAIELHRKDPSRGMGVFWMENLDRAPVLADSLFLMAFRAGVTDTLYGDTMLTGEGGFTEDKIGETPVIRQQGIWQNENDLTGGPFVTYYYFDPKRNRLLALDLVLYAPGLEKHPYMRELEALATTFHF